MKRNRLISLITASLLCSGVAQADYNALYVPLTTKDHDASWILFGVNGFSDGVGSDTVTTTSFSAGYTELEDTNVADNAATEGLFATPPASDPLASLQEIGNLTAAKIGVDISGITYSETEPVRSMYIRVNSDTPNLKFNYKASLEGKTMEIMVNNDTTKKYQVTISSEFTYSNAAIAQDATGSGASTTPLTKIVDVFDRDASDNPTDAARWDKTKHRDQSSAVSLADFYHFNALTQQWEVFKLNNVASANDFDTFSAGEGYWGRVDKGDNPPTNDADGATALVLGKSGNTSQDQLPAVYSGKLTKGWNLLSFDDIKPYIRHASTGMILDGLANGDDLTIVDDSGAYSFTISDVDMDGDGGLDADDIRLFNVAVESARLRGALPESFHLKALLDPGSSKWILISDKKFSLSSTNSTASVTTLYGNDPYVNGTRTTVSSLSGAGANVTSAYGEYMLIAKPLVGDKTADQSADNEGTTTGYGFAKIRFGYYTNDGLNPTQMTTSGNSVADVASTIDSYNPTPDFNPKAIALDMDYDGNADDVLIVCNIPFYIMDNTFARVYNFDSSQADGSAKITIPGTTPTTITPTNAAYTAGDLADAIDNAGLSDAEGATDSSGNKVILVATSSTRELKDAQNETIDFLQPDDSLGEDIAKGAISDISAVDAIAKRALVQHDIRITNFSMPDESGDGITVDFFGAGAQDVTFSTATPTNDDVKTFFDDVVNTINSQLQAQEKYGYASHDFDKTGTDSATAADVAATTIRVVGLEPTKALIDGGYLADKDGGGGNGGVYDGTTSSEQNTDAEKFSLDGSLTQDLKYNPVYTPNFAQYGPLYTMYDAGYVVKAILRATTLWSNGQINWDSIDTTRNETDWFANNEFNVFDVNIKSGYWVYLEDTASAAASDSRYENNISISNPSFTAVYSYSFANNNANLAPANYNTVNNVTGGSFTINVDGLSANQNTLQGTTSNVYLQIGGTEVQMKHDSGTKYTAEINKFNVPGFNSETGIIDFSIRATNGLGVAKSVSGIYSFDYQKPNKPTANVVNINTLSIASTSGDTAKYYVYRDYIPEINPDSSSNLLNIVDVASAGSVNVCKNLDFGQQYDLRIIAVDGNGAIGSANISDALQYNYINLGKNAHVLSHTYGTTKASTPVVYDNECQPVAPTTGGSNNDGVSLKVLVTGQSARMAYNAKPNVSFTTDVPWTTTYSTAGAGGTATLQIQSVSAYAGESFFIEYDGKLYQGTFPADRDTADGSTTNALGLTEITNYEGSIAP